MEVLLDVDDLSGFAITFFRQQFSAIGKAGAAVGSGSLSFSAVDTLSTKSATSALSTFPIEFQ